MQYRAEIDGLRALAVLPVILFHAGIAGFSGGFVGVDIFFVISGYLITSIILSEQQQGSFSLAGFYERRARRILPALMLIVLLSVAAAWYLLLPQELVDYGKSVAAVGLFASNVLFWQQSNYFAPTAEFIPLLHTWSLAVEEQFYLIFPVFMIISAAWVTKRRWVVLAVIALMSLVYCEWAWRHTPEANFFLAFSRAWELLVGVFCALYLSKQAVTAQTANPVPRSIIRQQLFSLLGLGLILASIFYLNNEVPFPSLYTLLPVLGTALIIVFAVEATWVAQCLSLRIFVFIGLLSYSAYLWHQPLFVFARLNSLEELTVSTLLLLSVLSFGLAYLSWRWVEQPFRNRKWLSQKQVLWAALACSIVLLSVGAVLVLGEGFNERFVTN